MTLTTQANITQTLTLDVIDIEPDLHVYRLVTAYTLDNQEGDLTPLLPGTVTRTGFITSKNLAKLKKGKSWSDENQFSVVFAQGRKMMRTHGYIYASGDTDLQDALDTHCADDVFDAFSTQNATPDDIVIFRNDCHMLLDRTGAPLPLAVSFDYISNGRISNGTYDLEKLVAHLQTRDDIVFTTQEVPTQNPIVNIPSYNSEPGRDKTASFTWIPTLEDYRTVWEECLAYGTSYPSGEFFRAIFELDMLGLRACGAALAKTYWGNKPGLED